MAVSMEANSGLNMWDALPEECKSMILSRLSNREAARIARVSKEFDQAVKNIRDAVQLLVLPPDLPPTALQGFVASHRNLKSLSFKRCSGKVKRFLPILEAAAGGKLDSKWYHRRSLESVDFRSCTSLTDADVNALCVLHSRLEDVNLANCQSISDVALTVLSRYRQSRPASDDVALDEFDTPAEPFEGNEEISASVSHSPPNPEAVSDNLWPELSPQTPSKTPNSIKLKNITPWGPRTAQIPPSSVCLHTEPEFAELFERGRNVDQDLKRENQSPPSRSYAQAALKALACDNVSPLSKINPNTRPVTLPHIDWTSVRIPLGTTTATMLSGASSDADRPTSSSTIAAGREAEMEDPSQDMLYTVSTWNGRNRSLLDEVKNPHQALPELMDALQGDWVLKSDLFGKESSRHAAGTEVELRGPSKVLVKVDAKGANHCNFDVGSSGDKRPANRQSLHVPNSLASTSEAEYNPLLKESKASKAIRVGGADQPLDVKGKKSAKKRVEAFRTTQADMGLFMLSRGKPKSRLESSDTEESIKINSLDTARRSERGSRHPQGSPPLPVGLEGLQGGTMMRHGKHRDIAPDLLEYQIDSPVPSCEGSEMEPWRVRGLSSVSLAGCSEISDKGVQALLRGPSKGSLLSLDISRCCGVTSGGLRLPPVSALKVLTAAQLPNITRLLLQLPIEGSLQHLSLAACPKLDDLHLVAPYLRTLNLSNCKKLTRLQLKCPELLSCNLSLCDSLETIGRFTCGALQSLNAYGCRLLTPAAFGGILESTPGLQELRCGGCDRLEGIDIPQTSLLRLEVPGCSSLRRLYVHSRVLKVVDACGCKSLVEAYLYSPNLRRMLFSNCALLQTLVVPLDSIKNSMDAAIKNRGENLDVPPEAVELSVSGCNVPDSVRKSLSRLSKQWKAAFAA